MKQKNILLTLMSLQIGGAETHSVELAKGLKKNGHHVVVASAGGIFEKELAEKGIKHYKVPLHNKKISNVRESYKALKEIIREEQIDLIHSHARIPAVISGILAKKYHIPFVTTAHGIRTTGIIWKYITNWGEKTIAVSEDVKSDLIHTYGVKEEDITLTINGIDTEKFSPKIDTEEIISKHGLSKETKKIVYISRLDVDRKSIVEQVIETAKLVKAQYSSLEVVIVGNGDAFADLKKTAEEANKTYRQEFIHLVGETSDTNCYIGLADVFIGFGRSCLEALSCGVPTILSSPYGYTGLFRKEKLNICLNNNFSCRGEKPVDREEMAKDILAVFALEENEKEQICSYGRGIITQRYSTEKMTADNEIAYEQLLTRTSKKYDVIISGYYGFGNSGDDAILEAILIQLRKRRSDIKVLVLSNNPMATRDQYKVDCIKRTHILAIMRQMKDSKLFLNGGGSLIQDDTSNRSIIYYLGLTYLANLMGMKTMLYANGIGPIHKKLNRKITAKVLNKCVYITLRESASAEELQALGVVEPTIEVTADPALNLSGCGREHAFEILTQHGLEIGDRLVGFAIREWRGKEKFISQLANVADILAEQYKVKPVFLCLHYPKDVAIAEEVVNKMKSKGYIIKCKCTAEETIGLIDTMELLFGMRLHALIYASANNIPSIGLVYDPKIQAFVDYVGQECGGNVENLDEKQLLKLVEKIWNRKDCNIKNNQQLKELAEKNADIVMDLL